MAEGGRKAFDSVPLSLGKSYSQRHIALHYHEAPSSNITGGFLDRSFSPIGDLRLAQYGFHAVGPSHLTSRYAKSALEIKRLAVFC